MIRRLSKEELNNLIHQQAGSMVCHAGLNPLLSRPGGQMSRCLAEHI